MSWKQQEPKLGSLKKASYRELCAFYNEGTMKELRYYTINCRKIEKTGVILLQDD
jgi:hypothetical protein